MIKLIGITGLRGAGKSTVAKILSEEFGFTEISFADPLKKGVQQMFNFNDEQIYGSEKEIIDKFWKVTPRALLQIVGTDLLREKLSEILPEIKGINNESLWIRSCEKKLLDLQNNNILNIVISDVRFQDEVAFIRRYNGEIWHVIRENQEINEWCNHHSEFMAKNLDIIKPNIIINNDNSINDLKNKIKNIIC